jgi:hypothetical protein
METGPAMRGCHAEQRKQNTIFSFVFGEGKKNKKKRKPLDSR